ncbi:hypothetical protein D3C76_805110 [compost metagenome]
MLITPPIASEPYSAERGPRMYSIRWMREVGIWLRSATLLIPALFSGIPSISTRTWRDSVPRIKVEALAPMPPLWAISTPGKRCITSTTLFACQRSISSRVTTDVGARTVFAGCSKRFAVTTNESALSCAQPENAVTESAVISDTFLIIVKASTI